MYSSRLLHLFLQQSVYHPMPRRLHLGLERLGGDEHAEMRLFGHAALHRLMVCVLVGVVVDLKCSRMQGCDDLHVDS